MTANRSSLKDLVKSKIGEHKFIIVSNREPYLHVYSDDGIRCVTPVSGMVIAIDPIMRACGGVWIAWGSGEADKEAVDSNDHIEVPPENPTYTLRRIWLTRDEVNGYYYGFSNEGLWPLCHIAYVSPTFRESDWKTYYEINRKFADAVIEELGNDTGFVFVQDYHFALLPKMIKEKRPDVVVAQFWHIPWPNPEAFRICPQAEEILEGLLGNDVLAFHIRYHCLNFLDTIDRTIEARIDRERFSVIRGGRETLIRAFPISVDFESIEEIAKKISVEEDIQKIRRQYRLRGRIVGVGVDRIDYTKGIIEKFKAIDRFFEKYPQYIEKFTFLQLGPISRIHISKYKNYNDEIYHLMVDINDKYRTKDWQPIILHKAHFSLEELICFYRLADVCIVSSLHDGMNLVAKEFVASRHDLNGALILSTFTGSARELEGALLINPYATEQFADTIKQTIELSEDEKKKRMEKLRDIVKENNVYKWGEGIINELNKLI
jgi:trehalose 6-phosphate synthase